MDIEFLWQLIYHVAFGIGICIVAGMLATAPKLPEREDRWSDDFND